MQANAEGSRIFARHSSSSTLSEKFDTIDDATRGKEDDDSRLLGLLVTAQEGQQNSSDAETIEETELFLKRVATSSYTHKSWTDTRRTLVYLRTEVRFYNEIVPLLLATHNGSNNNGNGVLTTASTLHNHLPVVHHADYDLTGLVPEDCPTNNTKQPSPFPENDNNDNNIDDIELQKNQLLQNKGGHILLQSLSPSQGYF